MTQVGPRRLARPLTLVTGPGLVGRAQGWSLPSPAQRCLLPGLQPTRLLLPPGREVITINQLLDDDILRKQNDYVEVGAGSRGCEGGTSYRKSGTSYRKWEGHW